MSTWDTPRFLRSYDETSNGGLVLPRGVADIMSARVGQAGSRLEISYERTPGELWELTFVATLTRPRQEAVKELLDHDQGVLVAPPGAGKTVIGCALIAVHVTSTLACWLTAKLSPTSGAPASATLLGGKAGQLSGGRRKTHGAVDVAMLQRLARKDNIEELVGQYGLVVVDECHHIPAAAFEHAVKQIPARRWLGLTATPYRDKLNDLIALQLDPIRHRPHHAGGRRRDHSTEPRTAMPGPRPVDHSPRTVHRPAPAARPRPGHTARRHDRHSPPQCSQPTDRGRIAAAGGGDQSVRRRGIRLPCLDTLPRFALACKGRLVQYIGGILRPHPGKPPPRYTITTTSTLACWLLRWSNTHRAISLGVPGPTRSTRLTGTRTLCAGQTWCPRPGSDSIRTNPPAS
jgi:hypothetical protein